MSWSARRSNNWPKFVNRLLLVSKTIALLVNVYVSKYNYLKLSHIPEMCKHIYWSREEW
jgi:hypothetical protein